MRPASELDFQGRLAAPDPPCGHVWSITANPAVKLGRYIRKDDRRRHVNPLTREQAATLLDAALADFPEYYPLLLVKFAYIRDMAFGLAICVFLIYEPNGLAYRWWQVKNYFNLWPFSY